jgi:putative membrane protein
VTNPSEPESSIGTGPLEPGSRGPLEGEPARLHPAALGVWFGRSLLSIIVLVVVAGMIPVVGVAIIGAVILWLGARYLRFRWRLEPDAVVIEEGLIIRKRRMIPRDRIQTVDLKRGVLHRVLGVVEVRIEAIGGGQTEGALAALDPALAERLRRTLLSRRAVGAPPESAPEEGEGEEEVWARVGPGALVMAGLTGGRVGVVAAVLGFLSQIGPQTWFEQLADEALGRMPDPTLAEGLQALILLGFLAFLAAFALSVAATVIAHWGFTLSSADETLGVRRGLLTQHRDTVPLHRIQAVRVEENLIRRLLGLGAVRAVVAGRAGSGGSDAGGLLLPVGSAQEAFLVARRAAGVEGEGPPRLTAMPPRALRRRRVRALAAALLAGVGAGLVAGARWDGSAWIVAALAFLACLLPAWRLAASAYQGLGWADHGGYLVVREGVFNRRTTFIPTERLQVLETRANPFQQRAGLSSLYLRVARPILDSAPRALDLDGDQAEAWRERLGVRLSPSPRAATGTRSGG